VGGTRSCSSCVLSASAESSKAATFYFLSPLLSPAWTLSESLSTPTASALIYVM
jgi:hypothetical protein